MSRSIKQSVMAVFSSLCLLVFSQAGCQQGSSSESTQTVTQTQNQDIQVLNNGQLIDRNALNLHVANIRSQQRVAEVKELPDAKFPDHPEIKKIIGPYTHKNLDIYIITGKDILPDMEIITLQEAIEKKLLMVHETGNVQQLSVENKSKDKTVFIQSGEIVKGGKQDRTLVTDLMLPPASGKVPLASYCVEQGRWAQRGNEKLSNFNSSQKMVASKSIRYSLLQSLGGKQPDKQSEVWRDVAKEQNKLSATTGQDLKSSQSASSYQLTLEHKKLQEELKEFKARLRPVIDKHPDVIGFAYRINGKFSNANVYGSSKLFKKLWPKLLDAASTEAIAETSKDYKGKVLKDVGENAKDNDKSVAGNEWMNALFVDGHVDGKRVDLEKGNKFYIKDEKDGIRNMTTNGGKVLRFNYEAK